MIFSYDTLETRDAHLVLIEGEDYAWEFHSVGNMQTARYFTSGVDGRVWVSGPYLVVIYSDLPTTGRNPWVDIFTEMYLPLPETGPDPLTWLRDQPFQPGKEEPAQLILSDLPEGFQAQDPESSSGDMMEEGIAYITRLQYQNPDNGQVRSENIVDVYIYSYDTVETRNAHLDFIESQEYQWEFQPISGDLVARYYTSSLDGRVWISGPYLIVIYSSLNDSPSSFWVVEFTEMYLELYPLP
jgi:hypothetical protein